MIAPAFDHTQTGIKRTGRGIGDSYHQRQRISPLPLRPACCRPQNILRGTLPTQRGGHFQSVQHGMAPVTGNKSHTLRPIIGTPKDYRLGPLSPVHHAKTRRANPGIAP
jgi:hypothetical protein